VITNANAAVTAIRKIAMAMVAAAANTTPNITASKA
jgi:hypothetical protein